MIVEPFQDPEVIVPLTDRSVPIYTFLAKAAPPAEVKVPPLLTDEASVVLEIAIPPTRDNAPVTLFVLAVVLNVEMLLSDLIVKAEVPVPDCKISDLVLALFKTVSPAIELKLNVPPDVARPSEVMKEPSVI